MESDTSVVEPSLLQIHFETSVDGQYVLDPESDVFVKVNPAMCELLGYTREQLVEARRPVSTTSIIHSGDREVVRNHRQSVNQPGDHGVMRFRIVRPDGEVRHLEVRFSLIRYMGRLVQVGSARDVSEQVRLEVKLRNESEFNRELTLTAQQSAKDAQKKSLEVLEANTRVGALAEVLRAIPVLTKKLAELDELDEVYKVAALTMVNDAQFSSCAVMLRDPDGKLEVKYANPFRTTSRIEVKETPSLKKILNAEESLVVDESGAHVAAIRAGGEVRGVLQVGLPKNLQRFYEGHKPIQQSIRDLVSTIADFIGVVISDHENLTRIKRQSRIDKLTGLYNRRVFEEQLTTEFRRALRYERDLSLLIMDIDSFKPINDTFGHQTGDQVLEDLGQLLAGSFRDLDTVCRYGGEEICVLLPETVGEAARVKAEQIRRKISEMVIQRIDEPGKTLQITVSVGIACVSKNTTSEEQLLREADRALYYCKNNGKNQVKLADG